MSKQEETKNTKVVNKNFQAAVQKELSNYINSETAFSPTHENTQKISQWLEESHS